MVVILKILLFLLVLALVAIGGLIALASGFIEFIVKNIFNLVKGGYNARKKSN